MIIQVINSVFFISIEKPKTGSKDGLKVNLSIQPNGTEVADLIDIILSRYVHHKSVIDVSVDMEWKLTGTPYHGSWVYVIENRKRKNLSTFTSNTGDVLAFSELINKRVHDPFLLIWLMEFQNPEMSS
jgi:hypothetical protein